MVVSRVIAASHDINLVRAQKAILLLFTLICHSLVYYFFLIHPEAGIEGTPELDFAVRWQFRNSHIETYGFHHGPDMWLLFVLPRFIFQNEEARARDRLCLISQSVLLLFKCDMLG